MKLNNKKSEHLFKTENEAKSFIRKEIEKKMEKYSVQFKGKDSVEFKIAEFDDAYVEYIWQEETFSVLDEYWCRKEEE